MKKRKVLRGFGIGVLTLGLFFNLQYALIDYGMFDGTLGYQLVAQANTGGGTGGGSTDDGGGSTDDGGGTDGGSYVREILTGQKLFVTKVTGQAAINAGISKGMLLYLNHSAQIKAAVQSVLNDAYTNDCYSGVTVKCTSID